MIPSPTMPAASQNFRPARYHARPHGLLGRGGQHYGGYRQGFCDRLCSPHDHALFGAFTVRTKVTSGDILNPWISTGLLFSAVMQYALAAWTMKSVGTAANDIVKDSKANATTEDIVAKMILISTRSRRVTGPSCSLCTPTRRSSSFFIAASWRSSPVC